jgi:hypothetical protein
MCGNSHARLAPRMNTSKTYSGIRLAVIDRMGIANPRLECIEINSLRLFSVNLGHYLAQTPKLIRCIEGFSHGTHPNWAGGERPAQSFPRPFYSTPNLRVLPNRRPRRLRRACRYRFQGSIAVGIDKHKQRRICQCEEMDHVSIKSPHGDSIRTPPSPYRAESSE